MRRTTRGLVCFVTGWLSLGFAVGAGDPKLGLTAVTFLYLAALSLEGSGQA